MEGLKHDTGKRRMDLLPFDALDKVAEVLTYGAEKYAPHSWRGVEPECYIAALLRHLSAHIQGEANDKESGISHLAHMATNALFLVALAEDASRGIRGLYSEDESSPGCANCGHRFQSNMVGLWCTQQSTVNHDGWCASWRGRV